MPVREAHKSCTIALAGNPNVGKSTVFNALTGLHQHTGNWAGKTVENAEGVFTRGDTAVTLADLPGVYSLDPRSEEERLAREYLHEGRADAVIVVCDACALSRGLHLALQILELEPRCVICCNLMDEARTRGIRVDCKGLSDLLGVPVIPTDARNGKGLDALMAAALAVAASPPPARQIPWDASVSGRVRHARALARACVSRDSQASDRRERVLDRLLTGKWTAFPLMAAMLSLIFWITIRAANVPSEALSALFTRFEPVLLHFLQAFLPSPIPEALTCGVYRVTAWVVSVMLPPMAVFFPLFTLAEDAGLLPRIAFDLDRAFCCCRACGKQALTVCMGFGCNAVGVTGCRIIDSPRERLIAILTNSLTPCNGRFPTLIALITLFFAGSGGLAGLKAALLLFGLILASLTATLALSRLLSSTLLRGLPSSFTLELPPYRRPQVAQVLLRSVLDRTLHVLARAVCVAAPAGLLLWGLGHVPTAEGTALSSIAAFLDPAGRFLGLDGVILTAFLLSLPANELLLPIILMLYLSGSELTTLGSLASLGALLTAHGWTAATAVCVMVFSLFHWPCATTLLTIRRETGSWGCTALAAALPTAVGVAVCVVVRLVG